MTMVSSGPISLGGNATTTGTGTGNQTYTFTVQTSAGKVTTQGFDPALFGGQTISPATTTIGGGSAITEIAWVSSSSDLFVKITGAANSGWAALTINGNVFQRTNATFAANTWTFAGVGNPFPVAGTSLGVVFHGVPGSTITLNQSVEVELLSVYGSPTGTVKISLNDVAVRALAGIPSGIIHMSDLYGKTYPFTYNYNLASGSFDTNFDLPTKLYIAGWNGVSPVTATITVGGVLGATNVTQYALQTGSGYAAGTTITVNVNLGGFITGAGGGTGTGLASAGGNAMHLQTATVIHNSGVIQGGGGSGNNGDDNFNGAGCGYMVSSAATIGTSPIGRVPKRGVSPFLQPVGGFTSDPLGPINGYSMGGSGQFASSSAQVFATIQSGGSYSRDNAGGSNNGGSGGSWVAGTAQTTSLTTYVYSPVLGGGGFGSSSPGTGEGTTNAVGVFGPGHSIDGVAFASGTLGTLRGTTT